MNILGHVACKGAAGCNGNKNGHLVNLD